jgi:hypothetical protein
LAEIIKPPDDPHFLDSEHIRTLVRIEGEMKSLKQIFPTECHVEPAPRKEMIELMAELYRLAALIYLERVGRGSSRFSPAVKTYLDNAFTILTQLDICERPFPLFIVGCEARSDSHRKQVLNVIQRTKKFRKCGNLMSTKSLIQAAWIQEDLHRETEMSCYTKYSAVVSSFEDLPSFT